MKRCPITAIISIEHVKSAIVDIQAQAGHDILSGEEVCKWPKLSFFINHATSGRD